MSSGLMKYEWMVKYTPEESWIQGKGIFLWLAFFIMEVCAGIYFVSLFVNLPVGRLIGWLVGLVVGGIFHLFFLGQPMRAWRVFLKPGSSELSRGTWIISLFAVIGFFQVLPTVVPGVSWTGEGTGLNVVMGILCILMITHGFLTMGAMRAVPVWNTSMMVPLSLASGIWVGSQVVVLVSVILGLDITMAEVWARWSLLGFIGTLAIFLLGFGHSTETAKVSIKRILAGDLSAQFYIGVVAIGIVVPLIITINAWGGSVVDSSAGVLFLRFLCVLIGDLLMRFCIMKSSVHTPLVGALAG